MSKIIASPAKKSTRTFGLGLGRDQSERLPVRQYSDRDYADYLSGRTFSAADFASMTDAYADRLAEESAALDSYEAGFTFA